MSDLVVRHIEIVRTSRQLGVLFLFTFLCLISIQHSFLSFISKDLLSASSLLHIVTDTSGSGKKSVLTLDCKNDRPMNRQSITQRFF